MFILCIYVFTFSIGEEYANLFMETDPNTDSPQTLEKRKQKGKLIYKGAISMVQMLSPKLLHVTA